MAKDAKWPKTGFGKPPEDRKWFKIAAQIEKKIVGFPYNKLIFWIVNINNAWTTTSSQTFGLSNIEVPNSN